MVFLGSLTHKEFATMLRVLCKCIVLYVYRSLVAINVKQVGVM